MVAVMALQTFQDFGELVADMGMQRNHQEQPRQNWGRFWGKIIHTESHFPNKYGHDTEMW
jgi:hypothetical protein